MKKIEMPPCEALYPVPVALVTSVDLASGVPNIITIAWCGIICSTPPLVSVSIRPQRHSHKLISASRDLVINIPSADMVRKVDLCGIKSGRDTDKFKACSFTPGPSRMVKAPLIKECPVNIECSVRDVVKLGAHDMFICEIVNIQASGNVIGQTGDIDYAKARPIVYNQGEYWDLGKKVGWYGFSAK